MSIKMRGELLTPTDQVQLIATFYNSFGIPANLISYPTVSLISPSGLVIANKISAGISQINVGVYLYSYNIGIDGPLGVYTDRWQGSFDGVNILTETLQFIVDSSGDRPQLNSDGYIHIGDSVPLNYSQTAIKNINKLLRSLSARLNNTGKSKVVDNYGNVQYLDCSIFSVELLVTFLGTAITDFNQVPYFTFFTFEDTWFVDQFLDILVEGATLSALASQALIERGREFQITDNGVNFTPPTVSELLQTQYSTLITVYTDKLKYIKNSLRPQPLGLGVFNMNNSTLNPAIRALNHLRARRLF